MQWLKKLLGLKSPEERLTRRIETLAAVLRPGELSSAEERLKAVEELGTILDPRVLGVLIVGFRDSDLRVVAARDESVAKVLAACAQATQSEMLSKLYNIGMSSTIGVWKRIAQLAKKELERRGRA